MIFLAQPAVDPSDPLTWFNLGLAGLFFYAGIKGLVWLKPAVEELKGMLTEQRAISSDLRIENKSLNEIMRESVVPAITTANSLSREATETLRETQELMRLLLDELKRRRPGDLP